MTSNLARGLSLTGQAQAGPPGGFSTSSVIQSAEDFPPAVGGVITLTGPRAYKIDGLIDIGVNQISVTGDVKLVGDSVIVSTLRGSIDSAPMVVGSGSLIFEDLTIEAGAAGVTLFGTTGSGISDVFVVLNSRTTGFSSLGSVSGTYGYVLFEDVEVSSNEGGITFDGTYGNIAFMTCLTSISSGNTFITVTSGAVINNSIAIETCALLDGNGATGINVDLGATIDVEGYRIVNSEFRGSGTPITGITQSDNRSYFKGNLQLASTYPGGAYYMVGNATETVISVANTWVKIAGTTTADWVERTSHTSNRLTYTGNKPRRFKWNASASLEIDIASPVGFEITLAKNGVPMEQYRKSESTGASDRVDNLATFGWVDLTLNDYVELWVRNTTGTTNVTAVDLTVGLSEVG